MILLRINSRKEEKIRLIATILLREKLAIDLHFVRNVEKFHLRNGSLLTERIHVLNAKTKALLFPQIDQLLRGEFGEEMPDIFSIPIAHMDWDKRDELAQDVQSV